METQNWYSQSQMALIRAYEGMCHGGKNRLMLSYFRDPEAPFAGRWSFIILPKHHKPTTTVFRYKLVRRTLEMIGEVASIWEIKCETEVAAEVTGTLSSLIIGKILDTEHLRQVIMSVQFDSAGDNQTDSLWVRNVVKSLQADGKALGTSNLDWSSIYKFLTIRYENCLREFRMTSARTGNMSPAVQYALDGFVG